MRPAVRWFLNSMFLLEAFVFGAGFLLFLAPCAVLAGWGFVYRSWSALWLSAALVLPTAFFLGLSPISSSIAGLPYSLARDTLWTSIALSPIIAIPGVWKRSRTILLMSAALSVPFGVWFVSYPGTRFYLALPFLHLIAAATVRSRIWWVSWGMLLLILGLEALFLTRFGGLSLLGVS